MAIRVDFFKTTGYLWLPTPLVSEAVPEGLPFYFILAYLNLVSRALDYSTCYSYRRGGTRRLGLNNLGVERSRHAEDGASCRCEARRPYWLWILSPT